jgi:glycosyltransferase involved in cell wall biosynthesis
VRIVVDALPTTHLSGRHVLLGHLANLAADHRHRHQFLVLHHVGNRHLRCDLGPNLEWIECPLRRYGWFNRLLWQSTRLSPLLAQLQADWLISTSGALVPGVRLPQIVLAQNPWCYFPQFHQGMGDRLKATSQRIGFRKAQRRADAVFYLSGYLANTYSQDAQATPRHGGVLYVGVDDATFAAAAQQRLGFDQRPLEVLTVSAMTPHKMVEDVVQAMGQLHRQGVKARLTLVGPWSAASYQQSIEQLVQHLGLAEYVTLTGKVSVEALHEHYRRARVFCLLSRCESFGIPAVEAQAFATPCVVANVCAPPEVAGPGGKVVPAGDIPAAAAALHTLLTEASAWAEASAAALQNVERFRWSQVSEPLSHFLANLPAR